MTITKMQIEASSFYEKLNNQLSQNNILLKKVVAEIKARKIKRVITIARGSSDCAANFAKYIFGIELGWNVSSLPPSLSTVYGQNIGSEDTLAIAISQSGGSPDLCLALESCKKAGCLTLALVNVEQSPLAEACDFVLPLRGDKEESVAATKSLLLSLTALVGLIAEYKKSDELKASLNELPNIIKSSLEQNWDNAIEVLKNTKSMFVIGRGVGYPIAQEMALKLKETCSIHAEAFSSAEVLHGPFALMNNSFTTFTVAQQDQSYKGSLEIAQKMCDLNVKTILACSDESVDIPVNAKVLFPATTNPLLEPIVALQVFYLMINKLTLQLGLNPDTPSNLNKVTKTI